MHRILLTAGAGALAMYFWDPQAGRRRRARTRDMAERAAHRLSGARLAVGAIGLYLLLRGGLLGRLGGAALLVRAATDLDFETLAGMRTPEIITDVVRN